MINIFYSEYYYSVLTFNVSMSCSCTGDEVFARLRANFTNFVIREDISGKHCIEKGYFFIQNHD